MKAFNPFGHVKQAPIAEQPQEHNDRETAAPFSHTIQQPRKTTSFNFDSPVQHNSNTSKVSIQEKYQKNQSSRTFNKPVEQNNTNSYTAQRADNKIEAPTTQKIATIQKGGFRLDQVASHEDLYHQAQRQVAQHSSHASNDIPSFEDEKKQLTAYEEKKILFNAMRDKVRGIKVSEIAKNIGATNKEDKIKNKWKMPWGHNVSIRGQKWFNHNSEFSNRGGVEAVSFAKYIIATEKGLNLDDNKQSWKAEQLAVEWLADTFGAEIDKSDLLMAKEDFQDKEKKRYTPPKNATKYLQTVVDYLHIERKLPMWVIQKQIDAGKLYAGIPKNFEHFNIYDSFGKRIQQERDINNLQENEVYCIFKSGDDKMGAAECRCVKDENELGFTKGFSEGSDKKYSGFFVVGEPGFEQKEVVLTEAAIDSMSYQVLHPWAHVMSTGGTDNAELMLRIICETLEHPLYNMILALDNDSAGDQAYRFISDKIKERYPAEFDGWLESGKLSRKVPPSEKDWNKFLTTRTYEEILSYYHKNTYEPIEQYEEKLVEVEPIDRFAKNVIDTPTPVLIDKEVSKKLSEEVLVEQLEAPMTVITQKRSLFTFASLNSKANTVSTLKKTKP